MTIDYNQAFAFMLISVRMAGLLVLNPIFGRQNIPNLLTMGFSVLLAVILVGTVPYSDIAESAFAPMLFVLAKELLVGLIAGLLFRMFLNIIVLGGQIIDLSLGISMARAFDPGTNSSVTITSGFLNALFILIFFVTDNHLTYIKMMSQTFEVIPLGVTGINWESFGFLPEYFSTILIFSVKLCLPIVVVETIITMAVGIIMRIIPQINIFVVNIQIKLFVGIFSLLVLIVPFAAFFENLIQICFEQIGVAWRMAVS